MALTNRNRNEPSLASSVRSITGLMGLLAARLDEIEDHRLKALRAVRQQIRLEVSDAQVRESANCKVCRSYFHRQGAMCGHCKVERTIRKYGSLPHVA
jgi:hypothetical protein